MRNRSGLEIAKGKIGVRMGDHRMACSVDLAACQATVTEATKLVLEAIAFQRSPHNDLEREAFQEIWQAKIKKFTERIAQEDPLAVEVILRAIEKESQGAGR